MNIVPIFNSWHAKMTFMAQYTQQCPSMVVPGLGWLVPQFLFCMSCGWMGEHRYVHVPSPPCATGGNMFYWGESGLPLWMLALTIPFQPILWHFFLFL
jgi:hypothetical protein